MLAAFLNKDRLAEFGGDREAALLGSFAELPCGPDLSAAERASDVIGTTDYPSVTRRHIVAPGVALIGDAAMVGDPLWGTGCGWLSIRGVACRRGVGRPAIREEP